jgi:hypothetical protein
MGGSICSFDRYRGASWLSGVATEVNDRKRVLIVCQLDKYANGVRPLQIQRFLQRRGHEVRLVDTYFLSKTRSAAAFALLAVGVAWSFIISRWRFGRHHLSYYVLLANLGLRRRVLSSLVRLDDFDLIMCETSLDAGVLTVPTSARTMLDSPTPWADELYFEGQLTKRQHAKLRRLETDLFESVDFLAFHWETYARYAVDHYRITGHNLITLNWGCTLAERRAEFSYPPRIVYLGALWQRAVDLPLLSRLTKAYPHIDVYGGPPPDPTLELNYLGWAPPTVLEQYQLGLITSTEDELRLYGFSAKHPQYLAYGLPVLAPAGRRYLDLLRGSVPYHEQTFVDVVEALGDEGEWRRMSDEAYAQAQRLTWDETLRPLDRLLRELPPARA